MWVAKLRIKLESDEYLSTSYPNPDQLQVTCTVQHEEIYHRIDKNFIFSTKHQITVKDSSEVFKNGYL
ncbi:hypothetical protein L208DRAFT_1387159 [Tricholoma matsutake]|nr:hypothetical protein L208DRAFT_1387159 [Tricholoma matsutake 945]